MTIEDVDKIILELRQQIPQLQVQLHQAEGYRQALVDIKDQKQEKQTTKP
jgi:predicted component of type VI protein secretion system